MSGMSTSLRSPLSDEPVMSTYDDAFNDDCDLLGVLGPSSIPEY